MQVEFEVESKVCLFQRGPVGQPSILNLTANRLSSRSDSSREAASIRLPWRFKTPSSVRTNKTTWLDYGDHLHYHGPNRYSVFDDVHESES